MLSLLLTLLLAVQGALAAEANSQTNAQGGEIGSGVTLTQGLALAPGVLVSALPPRRLRAPELP